MPIISFDVLTLFPNMLYEYTSNSIIGRAINNGYIKVSVHNVRNWSNNKHKTTDDSPFGGGVGMVMKIEPIVKAIESICKSKAYIIYLSPDGDKLEQNLSKKLAKKNQIILIAGHYEGIDQRVRDFYIHQEVSIGDYILTNGALAAAVVIDSTSRYIPGVLGKEKSLTQDAFNNNLLSFPQYTRPRNFRDHEVPKVLLSGNQEKIEKWRKLCQINKTKIRRPDLYKLYKNNETDYQNNYTKSNKS